MKLTHGLGECSVGSAGLRLAFLVLFACAWESGAATYYVTQAGSGSGTGSDYANAMSMATLNSRVAAKTIAAGDTVYLCDTFSSALNLGGLSGTSGNLITFRGDYPGHPGVLSISGTYGIRFNGTSYVRLYRLELVGTTSYYGIHGNNATLNGHNTFDSLVVHGWKTGFMYMGPNSEIRNCTVYGNKYTGMHLPGSRGSLIHDNYVHDNGTDGENSDGIYADLTVAGAGDVRVYGNRVENQRGSNGAALIDAATTYGYAGDMYIHNNDLRNCLDGYGIAPGGGTTNSTVYVYDNLIVNASWSLVPRTVGTFHFYNNTCITDEETTAPVFVWAYVTTYAGRFLNLKNNVFMGPCSRFIWWHEGGGTNKLDSNYNLFDITCSTSFSYIGGKGNWTWAQWLGAGYDANSLTGDPLFVNESEGDFQLQATSPARDSGVNVGSALQDAWDLAGVATYSGGSYVGPGSGPDMGCYEYWAPGVGPLDSVGNIDSTGKYAWSENGGWQNWNATHGGVTVDVAKGCLSGYVWGENVGWIKLGADAGGPYANTAADDYGVNMAADGKLSGYAWSETCGWINCHPSHSQVTIDKATGAFDGYAWSENLGWIHFKNASPAYNVRTTASFARGTLVFIR